MSKKERLVIENTILLVGMLSKLCKIELIIKDNMAELINIDEVRKVDADAKRILKHTKTY